MVKDNGVILQAERLAKRFGDVIAVDELSLDIREGEIFALLGPNGAGKTVTINMLCGLLKPDNGRILLNGKPFGREERHTLGMCPQNIVIWPKQTCLEQLVFLGRMYDLPPKNCLKRAEGLLEVMQLTEKRNKLADTLSGGMKRRLNLALALMHDPQILVLDECEAGLDPQSRILVRGYIRSWASSQGRTVVLTTHNMDEADRMADRVAIIDHGSLLVIDTPEALKRKVGEGDVLEVELKETGDKAGKTLKAVRAIAEDCRIQDGMLIVRTLCAADKLPEIVRALDEIGLSHGQITLRTNTLEDVFISLTGRRLRQ